MRRRTIERIFGGLVLLALVAATVYVARTPHEPEKDGSLIALHSRR